MVQILRYSEVKLSGFEKYSKTDYCALFQNGEIVVFVQSFTLNSEDPLWCLRSMYNEIYSERVMFCASFYGYSTLSSGKLTRLGWTEPRNRINFRDVGTGPYRRFPQNDTDHGF